MKAPSGIVGIGVIVAVEFFGLGWIINQASTIP